MNSRFDKIMPECTNILKSVKVSSMVMIGLLLIAVVLLFGAVLYGWLYKPKAGDEDKKTKILNTLTISGSILSLISLLAAFWTMSVSSRAINLCSVTTI